MGQKENRERGDCENKRENERGTRRSESPRSLNTRGYASKHIYQTHKFTEIINN